MTGKHASSLAPHWWETASALSRPYLKAHGKTLADLIDRLDELKSQGFDAIEVFAPCAGGVCYNGLDTIDFLPAVSNFLETPQRLSLVEKLCKSIVPSPCGDRLVASLNERLFPVLPQAEIQQS